MQPFPLKYGDTIRLWAYYDTERGPAPSKLGTKSSSPSADGDIREVSTQMSVASGEMGAFVGVQLRYDLVVLGHTESVTSVRAAFEGGGTTSTEGGQSSGQHHGYGEGNKNSTQFMNSSHENGDSADGDHDGNGKKKRGGKINRASEDFVASVFTIRRSSPRESTQNEVRTTMYPEI